MAPTSSIACTCALMGLFTTALADEVEQSLFKFGQVVRTINEQSGKPDQFSTTTEHQEFAARVAASLEPLNPLEMVLPCKTKYTPDLQRFEITKDLPSIRGQAAQLPDIASLNVRTLMIGVLNQKDSRYAASNGYGAEVTVSKSTGDFFYLASSVKGRSLPGSALVQKDLGPAAGQFRLLDEYRLQLYVTMPPETARTVAQELQCRVTFRLKQPFLLQADEHFWPTRNSPFETIVKGYALFGSVERFAVVNAKTGQVYAEALLARD